MPDFSTAEASSDRDPSGESPPSSGGIARWARLLHSAALAALLLSLATPLVADPNLIFPYVTTKAFFSRLMIQVAFVCWLPAALLDRSLRPPRRATLVAVALLLGALTAATAAGSDPLQSLWGTVEREDGLVTWIHLAAFLVVASGVLRSARDRELVIAINATVASSLALMLLFDPRLGGVSGAGYYRPAGTLGNPVHAAAYLVVSAFLCWWLAASSRSRVARVLAAVSGVLAVSGTFITATRGAILGLAGGAVAAAAVIVIRSGSRTARRRALAGAVPLALLAAGLLLARTAAWFSDIPVLQRLGTTKVAAETVTTRVLIWQAALRAVRDRPLLGSGPDNGAAALTPHLPARLFRLAPGQTWVDRAHSAPLDLLISGGVLALFAGLGLYLAAVRDALGGGGPSAPRSAAEAALLGGVVAHAVSNLVSFDVPTTRLLFFLMLALIAAQAPSVRREWPGTVTTTRPRRQAVWGALAVSGGCLLAGWAALHTVVRPARANLAGARALVSLQRGDLAGGLRELAAATRIGTYQRGEIGKLWTESVLHRYQTNNGHARARIPDPLSRPSFHLLEGHVDRHPDDLEARLLLVALASGSTDPGYLAAALPIGREALSMAPSFLPTSYALALLLARMGNADEALATLRRAVSLDPANPRSHANLAGLLRALGREREAEQEEALAGELAPPGPRAAR